MDNQEVIIVDGIPSNDYYNLIERSVKHAIISYPFFYRKFDWTSLEQIIRALAFKVIPKYLFRYFCENNDIYPDFDSCSAPFWSIGKRDFILNSDEWDIKNCYCRAGGDNPNYIDLPALISNRHTGDEWTKRNKKLIDGTAGVEFLFTYLKADTLTTSGSENQGEKFLDIHLSNAQATFIQNLFEKYGHCTPACPYSEQWFWDEFKSRGDDRSLFSLNSEPPLIITAYANNEHWGLFLDTGSFDRNNNWQDYIKPRWYSKTQKGSLNFFNGTLWTTITNATVPVSLLPSFLSLYPHLKTNIKYGRIGS